MSFIPCVTLANLTTPVAGLGTGSGGGGTYPANAQFSTISINPTSGVGITLGDNGNGYSAIYFNNNANTTDYVLQTQPTANPAIKTMTLTANPATSDSGISGTTVTTLGFPNANLNISTINGVVPGGAGGGAVDSVNGSAFKSIVASPDIGAVQLSLGALHGAFPITTLGVVNLSVPNSFVDIVQLGTSFPLSTFSPGWYSIIIPQMSVCVAQFPVGTPNVSAVYPGASIQYQIVCGQTGGQTSTSAIHNYVLVPANNTLLYAQTTPTTMVGMFYNPAALGSCNTLKLTAYYNPPDASGVTAVGYVSHSSPTPTTPGNNVVVIPLLSA